MFHMASPAPRRKVLLPRLPFWSIHLQKHPLALFFFTSCSFRAAPKALATSLFVLTTLFGLLFLLYFATSPQRLMPLSLTRFARTRLAESSLTEFKNQVLVKFCSQYGGKQTFTTAHHPASNGVVERTKRKILGILRHLYGLLHITWEDWVSQVANCTNSKSCTGTTTDYIFFLWEKEVTV